MLSTTAFIKMDVNNTVFVTRSMFKIFPNVISTAHQDTKIHTQLERHSIHTFGVNLLGDLLTDKGATRAGKGAIRAEQDF